MAESKESVIIEVDIDARNVAQELSRVTFQIATLKELQKSLKKEIDAGNDATGELAKQYAAADKELKLLTASQKALTGQLQAATEAENQAGDSFREMDAQLRTLENQYKSLTKAQRESAEGQELKKQIISLKKELKDFDAELGNHQRNVGNYAESILEADKGFGMFGGGLTGLLGPIRNVTLGMKAMSATPVIAILSILIGVLDKLYEKFTGNAAAMEKTTQVMGVFSGAANIVNVIIDKIAEGVGWLADKCLELAEKLGLMNDSMKESQRIAQEDLAIQKEQRDVALKNAQDQKRIAELKAQAQERDKYSTKERLAMMQEANDLEEAIAQRQYDLAKREYELQVAKNSLSESSQDDLKKENDLQIAMVNAETALFNKRKELNGQMAALRQQEAAEAKAASEARKKEAEERQKILDEQTAKLQAQIDEMRRRKQTDLENTIEDLKKEQAQELAIEGLTDAQKLEIEQYYQEQEKKLRDEAAQAELEAVKQKEQEAADFIKGLNAETEEDVYNDKMAKLQAYYDEGLVATEEYEAAKAEIESQYAQQKAASQAAQAQEYLSSLTQMNAAIAGIEDAALQRFEEGQDERKKALEKRLKSGEISEEQYAKETEKLEQETDEKKKKIEREQAIREKALGIMNAAISTGVAIIKMLADPGGIAGVALSAMAGFTGAAQVAAIAAQPLPQFASGGVIGGESYTGDHVLIRANSGEGVYTGKQANTLLQEIANNPLRGGVDYEPMAAAMAAAVAAMPAPVVDITEMHDFEDKVTTYNELAAV